MSFVGKECEEETRKVLDASNLNNFNIESPGNENPEYALEGSNSVSTLEKGSLLIIKPLFEPAQSDIFDFRFTVEGAKIIKVLLRMESVDDDSSTVTTTVRPHYVWQWITSEPVEVM